MSLPTFAAEAAFGNNVGDSTLTYTDVSSDLKTLSFTRGRQYELNQMSGATGTATLKNLLRQYDPTNTAGTHYPNVVPLTPFRLSATLDATTYRLLTGFAARWPQNRAGPSYAETQVPLVDGFEILQNAVLPTPSGGSYPQELSGSRISRTLDAAGWSTSARSIDTGASEVPSYTFARADGVAALDHLLAVAEQGEIGLFFIAKDGTAMFIDRHSSLGLASQATFTDQPTVDTGDIGYSQVVATIDKDLIFNDWVGTRTGGTPQEATDTTSTTRYGQRGQTRTPLLVSDSEVLLQMEYLLSQYKDPALRIESITITPGDSSTAWAQVLGREIGDRITVRMHPPGGGDPIVQDSFIQQINLQIPDPHAASATCTWQLLPASILGYWFAGYSHVDTDTRAGY